ncbi:hypothetical protein ACH5RR_028997 [Cinchona calisaya]|uniref:Uncharacterized protein n=1 Tax=Cinchona calisaya TaxID=153742 RepID=A0ABD2YRU0_9GENT
MMHANCLLNLSVKRSSTVPATLLSRNSAYSSDYKNYDSIRAYVDSWVRFLVNLKAIELELDFNVPPYNLKENNSDEDEDEKEEEDDEVYLHYSFHFSDLIDCSVKVLKLHSCGVCLPGIRALPV